MRHLTTLGCLVAALACYLMSFENGTVVLFVAGAVFEGIFWMRYLRSRGRDILSHQP